ncbi:hypothetical protein [Sediminicola sp. 1XM1-17]|uniref:hypothetical protein n=1 Tax=Sediminicola sp. 1XM1-17 TaxID=3127702 RepID=UPI003077B0BE
MNQLTIYSYALLDIPKIHTDLLWDLTLLFSVLALVYFGVIFFFRNKFTSKTKMISERKKQLSPMISEFLFFDANNSSEEEYKNYIHLKIEIRDLIKDEFNHQILSDILIDLQKDVSGETLERLYKLFKDLGLHNNAFDKLRSYRWQVVSQGIMELTHMSVTESYGFITKFINDKRGTVRKQAELATVSLEERGISHFLDTTRYQISEWQQLKLMDILRNREDFTPPRFKRWLTSNNKGVVLFALRLLKFYDQNDANNMLIQLVRHKNKQIKEEAISCIQKFGVVEALDTLKAVFWNSNVNGKVLILDTISELGSINDIEFLQNVENKSFNFIVKSKALSTIHLLSPDTAMSAEDLEDIDGDQNFMAPEIQSTQEEVEEDIAIATEIPATETVTKEEEKDISEITPPEEITLEEEILAEDFPKDIIESPTEAYEDPEIHALEEQRKNHINEQPMKEEKKEKSAKETFILSMEDLKNLEVISDEILYAMDYESFDKFLNEIPDLDDFIAKDTEEPLIKFKPDFNGLRLDKDRTASNDNFYEDIFSKKDDCDKNILLDTIYDVGDEREIPILKQIIVNEENVGIRDKALKILNGISEQNHWYSEEEGAVLEIEKIRDRCIFKPLFETADLETKLMLLDQIGAIGDTKEIKFLNALLETENQILKKKIEQTLILLEERLQLVPVEADSEEGNESSRQQYGGGICPKAKESDDPLPASGILMLDEEIPIEKTDKPYSVENFQNTKGKMPLDFCFLLDDLSIRPSPSDLLEVDFELDPVKDQHTNMKQGEQPKNEPSSSLSILDQILSLPAKIKDIFNG